MTPRPLVALVLALSTLHQPLNATPRTTTAKKAAPKTEELGAANKNDLKNATEILLPAYQAAALGKDAPLADCYLDDNGGLWVLGRKALWQWVLKDKKLRRLPLHGSTEKGSDGEQSDLRRLASDGINLFAVSDHTLYQYHPKQNRVFRYEHPVTEKGVTYGFSGAGDDFWWVHQNAVLKVDRYGKSIVPKHAYKWLKKGDVALYDAKGDRLLFVRKHEILQASLQDGSAPKSFFKAKHEIKDLQRDGQGFVAHTASAVLRLGPTGKLSQSIPVEGKRQLVRMTIAGNQHAYLFSDQLLEVFDVKAKTAKRYVLPIESGERVTRLSLRGSAVALVVGGEARAFHLAP